MEDRLIGEEDLKKLKEEEREEEKNEEVKESKEEQTTEIYAVRTTAGREDQVVDFIRRKVEQQGIKVYSILRPHGMRGYIFIEAENLGEVEEAIAGVPYARGVLKKNIAYKEIEHHIEQEKREIDIRKNDIAEIISGPFKGEQCKVTRIDKAKGEVVVQLLESAVPIPITVSIDSIKVIRREE